MSIKNIHKKFHGKRLTEKEANYLDQKYNEFVIELLQIGRQKIADYENHPQKLSESDNIVLSEIHRVRDNICEDIYFNNPTNFKKDQDFLYKLIYTLIASDEMIVFYEFCIGLLRFDIAVRIFNSFLKDKTNKSLFKDKNQKSWFQHLDYLGKVLSEIYDEIHKNDLYKDGYYNYWLLLNSYLNDNINLSQLAGYITDIHYIPKDKIYVSLSQILHWKGWGGDGEVLFSVFNKDFPNLLNHAINYLSDKKETHFTKVISDVLSPLIDESDENSSKLAKDLLLNKGTLRVCDFGSGIIPQEI